MKGWPGERLVFTSQAVSFYGCFPSISYLRFCLFFPPGKQLSSCAKMSGIGNKRMAGEPGTSIPPEKKTAVEDSGTTVETIKLGGVSSTVCGNSALGVCFSSVSYNLKVKNVGGLLE